MERDDFVAVLASTVPGAVERDQCGTVECGTRCGAADERDTEGRVVSAEAERGRDRRCDRLVVPDAEVGDEAVYEGIE